MHPLASETYREIVSFFEELERQYEDKSGGYDFAELLCSRVRFLAQEDQKAILEFLFYQFENDLRFGHLLPDVVRVLGAFEYVPRLIHAMLMSHRIGVPEYFKVLSILVGTETPPQALVNAVLQTIESLLQQGNPEGVVLLATLMQTGHGFFVKQMSEYLRRWLYESSSQHFTCYIDALALSFSDFLSKESVLLLTTILWDNRPDSIVTLRQRIESNPLLLVSCKLQRYALKILSQSDVYPSSLLSRLVGSNTDNPSVGNEVVQQVLYLIGNIEQTDTTGGHRLGELLSEELRRMRSGDQRRVMEVLLYQFENGLRYGHLLPDVVRLVGTPEDIQRSVEVMLKSPYISLKSYERIIKSVVYDCEKREQKAAAEKLRQVALNLIAQGSIDGVVLLASLTRTGIPSLSEEGVNFLRECVRYRANERYAEYLDLFVFSYSDFLTAEGLLPFVHTLRNLHLADRDAIIGTIQQRLEFNPLLRLSCKALRKALETARLFGA